MSRQGWSNIKNSNFFYVRTYRQLGSALSISLILNSILGLAVYFAYINQPIRDFYSTDGITPPVKLTPRLTANQSSQALLAPDPDTNDYQAKMIPQ